VSHLSHKNVLCSTYVFKKSKSNTGVMAGRARLNLSLSNIFSKNVIRTIQNFASNVYNPQQR